MDITTYTLAAAIPQPLRVVQVADLHSRPFGKLLNTIDGLRPDLIAETGDCIHNFILREQGLAFLRAAAARWPVFCSLGNHETAWGEELCALMRDTGAVVLDNDAMHFRGLFIGGLSSGFRLEPQSNRKVTPPPDLAFLQAFAAHPSEKLLLCHHPEYYPPYIRPLPIRLTLSGHAHGGQWRVRGRGVFAPGQGLFPQLTAGLVEDRLIISRGLGNPNGIPRFGNPTELVVIDLKPLE